MTSTNLPDAARTFIDAALVAGDMALPFHYPRPEIWASWQSGFRHHGLTGECLVGTTPGAWQPGWHVIALNGFDDPFFIDLGEAAEGFPVYHARIGAGRWDAAQVAPSLPRFAELLIALRDLGDDDAAARRLIETEVGLDTELWREVFEGREDRPASTAESEPPLDPAAWQHGRLVITAIGPQKLEIAQFLRQARGLSPRDAMALIATQDDLVVAEGCLARLRHAQARLQALGATVVFVPHPGATTSMPAS